MHTFLSAADNVSNELKSIGVETTVVQEPYSTYANDLDKGLYTFAESWGNGNNSTPYYQYYYMFNPSESAPIGKVATSDWERFTSPVITKALATYSGTSSVAVQKTAMAAIEKTVLTDVPLVPRRRCDLVRRPGRQRSGRRYGSPPSGPPQGHQASA